MGMALSAPQTPPAKTKNEQNILSRSWDPFLLIVFATSILNKTKRFLAFLLAG